MARNAKDCAVSYFHFGRMNNAQPEPGDWSTFLQKFMEGKSEFNSSFSVKEASFPVCSLICFSVPSVVFGPWYDHVNNWWEKKQTYSKLHYMFYEDLIEVR